MSRTIDDRVVSMQFDNKHFEKNVQTSLSTLDKLKQSLNLTGATKGFEEIDSASKKVNMSNLGSAVETIRSKFSALEIMAVTALANITNSAVNAGKRIASSLTIEPIKAGLSEYETQINAVQTILANTERKGTTLDDVNGALDELNTYADKTIYNFTEMTRNIGTFTAAGVDLDTSVSAIKGIANLAAVSGSTSQQASTAMYQLSQALASGTVKLMDWNSVVNAGMGGQVFQDALKETARVHGIAIDDLIKKEGSFRETLQHGWLSSEILTETLSKFTGDLNEEQLKSMGYTEEQIKEIMKLGQTANDAATKVKTFTQLMDTLKEAAQSGWSQTWEILIGDFEEAKELWSSVSDIFSGFIGASAKARNDMLQGWADGGGRTMAIEALKNTFEGLMSILKPIKEAFREIFPKTTAEQLLKITKAIKDLTAKFKLSDEQSAKLKSTFKGLFSIVDIGLTFIKEIVKGVVKLIGNLTGLGDGILGVTGSIGDWISGLRDTIKETNIFGVAVDKVTGFLQKVIDKIKEFFSYTKDKFSSPGFEGFLGVMMGIWNVLKNIGKKILEVGASIGRVIGNAFRNGDIKSVVDVFSSGVFAAILLNIRKFISGVTEAFGEDGILGNVIGILDSVRGCFEAYQQNLKSNILLKIAVAIGILAASLYVISGIDSDKLASSLGAIAVLFVELIGAVTLFDKLGGVNAKVTKSATLMIGMSIAILILSKAVKSLSTLSWEELAKGLIGVATSLGVMIGALHLMPKKGISKTTGLIAMATAIVIVGHAVKAMGRLSWEELAKGLVGMAVSIAAMAGAMNLLPKGMISKGLGLIAVATAVTILSNAIKTMGKMSWENLIKGLTGLAVSMVAIAGAMRLMPSSVLAKAISLIGVATAITIIGNAMKSIADMSWAELAKGLVAVAGSLLIIAGAMHLMPKDMLVRSVSLIGVATAITILGNAISNMGDMSWSEIGKGLAVFGGSMIILAAGLNCMKGTLAASAALLVASAALAIFTPIIKSLGGMSLGNIGKSLLALAGVFTVLGLAALILKPLVGTLLVLSVSIAIFGAGCALVGAGILAVSVALTSLGASLVVVASSIVETIKIVVQGLGDIIVTACSAVIESAPALAEALVTLIASACYALKEVIPTIAETLLQLLIGILSTLKKYLPQLVDLLADLLISLFDKLSERIPDIVNSAVKFIGAFITALNNALGEGELAKLISSLESIAMIFVSLGLTAKIVSTIPIAGAIQGIVSLGIFVAGIAAILAALGGLAQIPGFTWLIGEGTKVLGQIGTAIGTFVGNIIGGFMAGATSGLPQMGQNLSDFMTNIEGFITGAKSIDASMVEGVKALASAILAITAADMLSGIMSWLSGGSSISDFGEELVSFGESLAEFSKAVVGVDPTAIMAAAMAGKALAQMAAIVPNEGGMVAWFTGENSLAKFGTEFESFGKSLAAFSTAVADVNPETVKAAAEAGKALAQMADMVPNEGGVAAWFAGENSLASFGDGIVAFGQAMSKFSIFVTDVNPEAIKAAAEAGKALAQMADTVPNEGGIAAWFAGENSLASFGEGIVSFGQAMATFSNSVTDINPAAVIMAATAGKALAQMADTVPNEGGIAAWFAGENSLASFGEGIVSFGQAMAKFSVAVAEVNPAAITAASMAGKTLAQMADTVPNEGGIAAWFAGENSLASFSDGIIIFGQAMAKFSVAVAEVNPAAIMAAATAGKTLAQMADTVPNEGGIAAWFAGENSLASFSDGIVSFGQAMAKFSEAVVDINPEAVKAAATAGKTLAEMASIIPNEGGLAAWFSGDNSIASFSEGIVDFGEAMSDFSEAVVDINPEKVKAAATAGKSLAQMADTTPSDVDFVSFGSEVISLGNSMKTFSDKLAEFDVTAMNTKIAGLKTSMKYLGEIGEVGVKSISDSFKEGKPDVENCVVELVNAINNTVKSKTSTIIDAFNTALIKTVMYIKTTYANFFNAGCYLVEGFANGITSSTFKATAKAKAMALKALEAAKEALGIESPSKEFYEVGAFAGEGFINALSDQSTAVFKASSEMAAEAKSGLSKAISKVSDILNSDMDTQPTIRPVLDLSAVTEGANSINGMFGITPSVGVLSNIGTISSMMNRNQNGSNLDVISAIKDLGRKISSSSGNVYNVNGVTYDDGSNVSDAVKALVRAARVERRI